MDFFSADGLYVLVELVGADSLDEVFHSTFNFVVLRLEFLRLVLDPDLLHLHEVIESEGLSILREVDQDSLGQSLEVVLNSVLHDIVDVDDQLLELSQALVHVMQVAVDVHGSPGEGDHAWPELVLKVFQVRHEQTLSVGADLVDNTVVLTQHEVQLCVVHLKLVLLEKDDLG